MLCGCINLGGKLAQSELPLQPVSLRGGILAKSRGRTVLIGGPGILCPQAFCTCARLQVPLGARQKGSIEALYEGCVKAL